MDGGPWNVSVLMFANEAFWPMAQNSLRHLERRAILPAGAALLLHAFDRTTHASCERERRHLRHLGHHVRCLLATELAGGMYGYWRRKGQWDNESWYQGRHGTSVATCLLYKLQAAHTMLEASLASGDASSAVVILDADAMIASAACLHEWLAFPEDIVIQTGKAPGDCPASQGLKFGFALNTGAVLLRPPAAHLLRLVAHQWPSHRYRYPVACPDQELLSYALQRARPAWHTFPSTLTLQVVDEQRDPMADVEYVGDVDGSLGGGDGGDDAGGGTAGAAGAAGYVAAISMRLLNVSRWPAGGHAFGRSPGHAFGWSPDKRFPQSLSTLRLAKAEHEIFFGTKPFTIDRRLTYPWVATSSGSLSTYVDHKNLSLVQYYGPIALGEVCIIHVYSGNAAQKVAQLRLLNLSYLDSSGISLFHRDDA